jgi:protocatechuate 3,4-dioxygenase beta subunit
MQNLRLLSRLLLLVFLLSACSPAAALPTDVSIAAAFTPTTPVPTVLPPTPADTQSPVQAATAAASPTQPQPTRTAGAIACAAPASLTPPMTEGPYFKANSPQRASLLGIGLSGTILSLSGYVLTQDCKPVTNALLDFWQADSQGNYDNTTYTLRGHQFTDADGHYQLDTIIPGLYPGRTEHIHVKIQAPNGPILTTQLFFPGVVQNESDSIYDPHLLIALSDVKNGKLGAYNFVISLK